VLALTRKYKSTEVACNDKDTINNIFVKKEKRGGKATPSQPVQQPQATQLSTNANAKANQTGAKRPCNRCGEKSTYEHMQNCPAKADTCTNCKKKGNRAVICHNGKRLNANGQVASASATAQSDPKQISKSSKHSSSTRGNSNNKGTNNSSSNKMRNARRSPQTLSCGHRLTPVTQSQRLSATLTPAHQRHHCSCT
jgi:hypothetical protein